MFYKYSKQVADDPTQNESEVLGREELVEMLPWVRPLITPPATNYFHLKLTEDLTFIEIEQI